MQASNPIFADPVIAILPRIFIGVISYYVFISIKKYNLSFSLILTGVIGTLFNTLTVLGLAVIKGYLPFAAALSVAFIHGIPEAIIAAILVSILGRVLINKT